MRARAYRIWKEQLSTQSAHLIFRAADQSDPVLGPSNREPAGGEKVRAAVTAAGAGPGTGSVELSSESTGRSGEVVVDVHIGAEPEGER